MIYTRNAAEVKLATKIGFVTTADSRATKTDEQTYRQTDRQIDRQIDGQTARQTDR